MSCVHQPRRRVLGRLLVVMALVFSGMLISPLGAHTEVFARSPIAGEAVGGSVDQIDISFWAQVLSSNITVFDPSGAEMETDITRLVAGGRIASTTFPELTESGRYTVTHTELSPDGDVQTAEWFFVFDPESDVRAVPLLVTSGEGGPNWVLLAGVSGIILILAGLMWPRRDRKTAAA